MAATPKELGMRFDISRKEDEITVKMTVAQASLSSYFAHIAAAEIPERLMGEYIKQYGREILAKIDPQAIGNAITARVIMELGARLGLAPEALSLSTKVTQSPSGKP